MCLQKIPEFKERRSESATPAWQQTIWRWCSLGLLAMILLLIILVGITLAQVMEFLRDRNSDNLFVFAGISLVTANLLRLIAILIGGAISFVGLAVSFFAHQKAITLDADIAKEELGNAKAALATHSPGIVAVLVGAVVIISALYAKGTHTYQPSYNAELLPAGLHELPPLPPDLLEAQPAPKK
jgi:Na+/proline symporter